ncbi:methyltransferase domain-containing protein [Actinotalea sp. BY-33]|uniref:Methyltransferase domain-containing protein n=1 Tax=Actinotalea soli TaxID=2819234 RepID=A0A939RU17_9CELL|nr:methyltransferase domain-containing protein [Actinotalea soli]MBO1752064.1 methyltransferase domain-containing protein [Actinotalea soli]
MVAGPEPLVLDAASYMGVVAGSAPGREYKAFARNALDLRPGLDVVDVGCGPGTDLRALADAVGPTGSVLGVDRDPTMLERAGAVAEGSVVEVRQGDAHDLPLADATVDRVRTDRVLQHVVDPRRAVDEVRRVLRPGGRAVFAEPDWDTLAIAAEEVEASRRFRDHVRDVVVRNGHIGRQLAGHAHAVGLQVTGVDVVPGVFRDLALADTILGIERNVERAIASGHLATEAREWVAALRQGPFVATLAMFVVTAEKVRLAGGAR